MDSKELGKLTVAQLRDEAKKLPNVKGISSMKKGELVELLSSSDSSAPAPQKAAVAAAKPKGRLAKPTGKTELKQRIRELKELKREALSRSDGKKAKQCNREIHHYKHLLRRMAREAASNQH